MDFLNDPKLIALAFEDQRHFIGVLALKSDGALDGGTDPDLLDRIVAQRLWIDHAIIRDVKKRLVAAGLIDTSWQPVAWERRQFKSDSSKDRVARFRAKKKGSSGVGNGDETLQQRPSNAVDTDADTDTEVDTAKELETEDVTGEKAAAPAASPKASEKRATRLAADWVLPNPWGQWALAEFPAMTKADVRKQADVFADYWHSEAGQKARKLDWLATWRNWIRRHNEQRRPGGSGQQAAKYAGAAAAIYGGADL
ncbi:hypothetical protein ACFIQF_22760 [Comamonas sp. J-3]|uniref:hypothetical protein n=1 Tax=Comamonas trifloxystrobinivorans TaxID=3350256 RepID=UPI00372709C2